MYLTTTELFELAARIFGLPPAAALAATVQRIDERTEIMSTALEQIRQAQAENHAAYLEMAQRVIDRIDSLEGKVEELSAAADDPEEVTRLADEIRAETLEMRSFLPQSVGGTGPEPTPPVEVPSGTAGGTEPGGAAGETGAGTESGTPGEGGPPAEGEPVT